MNSFNFPIDICLGQWPSEICLHFIPPSGRGSPWEDPRVRESFKNFNQHSIFYILFTHLAAWRNFITQLVEEPRQELSSLALYSMERWMSLGNFPCFPYKWKLHGREPGLSFPEKDNLERRNKCFHNHIHSTLAVHSRSQ